MFKAHHVDFYQPNCITKLKYNWFRPVLKYNLFTKLLNYYKKVFYFFSPYIKWAEITIFDDKKIKKSNFYQNKKLSKIDDINVDKLLVSKKSHKVQKNQSSTLLHKMMKMLLQPLMIGYVKWFDGNKTISFKVIDNKLLKSTPNGKDLVN